MDDQRRSRGNENKSADPAEGVRIIGADEAAEAMERGDVAPRRTDDELRYGDRPPAPPAGPRPALRFPLDASADPTRIERPPVQPAPDPVTGPVELPHWTDPPTREVPAVLIGDDGPLIDDDGDELDAWSSFATSTPRWRDADDDWADDGFVEQLASDSSEVRIGALGNQDDQPTHDEYFGFDDLAERVEERTGDAPDPGPRWETGDDDWNEAGDAPSVVAGADDGWAADEGWADEPATAAATLDDDGAYEPVSGQVLVAEEADETYDGWGDEADEPPAGERDLAQAGLVGAGLAGVAILLLVMGAKFVVPLVAVVLGLAAAEYFNVLRKVGWESATLVGLVACVTFPFAIYWRGPVAFPLLAFLTVAAVLSWYLVGAGGRDPRVLEGSGSTILGVAWIGGLGSAAAAILRLPDGRWLLVAAILATVAYDVGGLFIGRAMGHRPLSAASPNKTFEGLLGGMACAFAITIIVVGILEKGPWNGFSAAMAIGIGAACAAPLGDLCQSLLKRDLGVKDMGTILPGHGGVLDRFDGMLFVLPTVFWLTVALGTFN